MIDSNAGSYNPALENKTTYTREVKRAVEMGTQLRVLAPAYIKTEMPISTVVTEKKI